MTVQLKEKLVGTLDPAHFKKFYQDEYVLISFVESVPCIKVKVTGVPQSSEHFQFVQRKVVEAVLLEKDNYCRLHMLTDNVNAGIVLNEDMDFYKYEILPQIEKAGIRYHAIVLPESNLVRNFMNSITLSTKKIEVEYFSTVSGASKWLRHR
jgi:hypothetical protein